MKSTVYCVPILANLLQERELLDSFASLNQLHFINSDNWKTIKKGSAIVVILDHGGLEELKKPTDPELGLLNQILLKKNIASSSIITILLDFRSQPDNSKLPEPLSKSKVILFNQPLEKLKNAFNSHFPVDVMDLNSGSITRFDTTKNIKVTPKISKDIQEIIKASKTNSALVFPQGGVVRFPFEADTKRSLDSISLGQADFERGFSQTFEHPVGNGWNDEFMDDPFIAKSRSGSRQHTEKMKPRASVDRGFSRSHSASRGGTGQEVVTKSQPNEKENLKRGTESSNQNTLNEVLLGASAPESVAPASEFTARFVAYIESESDSARKKLHESNKQNVPHMSMERCQWKPGTTVMVGLKGSDLIIDEPVQEFKWNGEMNDLEFDVSIKEDAKHRNIVLKYDVFIEDVRVAKLRLDLSIGTENKNNIKDVTVSPAKTAFASYSSKDRKRVLDRVSAIEINSGINVFIDCTSLRTGKEWKPQLEDKLRNSDLFLLFWSLNAQESKWVNWEWKTAYKFPKEIQIQPLDPVDMAAPPEELKNLHFGDHRMIIRKYMELREKSDS